MYFRRSFSSGDFRIRHADLAGFLFVLFYFLQTLNQSHKSEVAISNCIL